MRRSGTDSGDGKGKGGDRTAFLNATKSAALAENIKKEERAVYALFLKQMELGRLTLPEDDVAQPSSGHSPSAEAVQADPALIARLVGAGQPEAEAEQDPSSLNRERLQDISRNVWSVANPGYLERPSHFKSSAQADFGWDEAEVEAMRQQGELDSRHHRKRDGFTAYAEASLRNTHMQRRGGGEAAKPQ